MTDIVVITGLSGAGRSQAADSLEDLGWFVVDNLPSSLIAKVAELASAPGSNIASGSPSSSAAGPTRPTSIDVVGPRSRAGRPRVRILFLEASDDELVRRYGSTRRKHPLSRRTGTVLEAIEDERHAAASR